MLCNPNGATYLQYAELTNGALVGQEMEEEMEKARRESPEKFFGCLNGHRPRSEATVQTLKLSGPNISKQTYFLWSGPHRSIPPSPISSAERGVQIFVSGESRCLTALRL